MQNPKFWLTSRFPALASHDYVLFVIGQFISVIGTWMQATALPYLAYRISGRPLDLGLIGFSTTLPTLLFALPAGVLVERWDKRKVVIILQAVMSVQAFGLAYLTFTGQLQIWHIVALAFLYGSAVAVEDEYVLEALTAPLIICILVDWLGPLSRLKSLNSGALNEERELMSLPEKTKDTSNRSPSATLDEETFTSKDCAVRAALNSSMSKLKNNVFILPVFLCFHFYPCLFL